MGNARSFRRAQQSAKDKKANGKGMPLRHHYNNRLANAMRRNDWNEDSARTLPVEFRRLFEVSQPVPDSATPIYVPPVIQNPLTGNQQIGRAA